MVTTSSSQSQLFPRIISGSLGAIVTHLAVTPLEVCKIRQQTSSVCDTPLSKKTQIKTFLRGRGTVVLSNGLMLPKSAFPCLVAPGHTIDVAAAQSPNVCSRLYESTLAHHSQSSHAMQRSSTSGGLIHTLRSIFRAEGVRGLYAGLRPTLLMSVPNTALYLSLYDEITVRLRQHSTNTETDANGSISIPLIAGAISRLVSSVATAPLELIRTRQASLVGNSTSKGAASGIIQEFQFLYRTNGLRSFYTGLGPMLWRDVPFSSLYFLCLEQSKAALANSYREQGAIISPSVQAAHVFGSGLVAGAVATALTTPFDVIKTRRQMVAKEGHSCFEHSIPSGTIGYMRHIFKVEGMAGLWRGNKTRMLKVAPACAIMISCYDFGKKVFEEML
jgi:solute carrier family 25 protein 39/40